jgi:probable dihydroxyacetone kinase regulator
MTQRTKKALADSLSELLLTKPINQITISDITEHCGVSRMTFYYHFKDIYDLVDWIFTESITHATEDSTSYDTWNQGYLNVFHLFQKNRPLIMNIYRHVSTESLRNYLDQVVYPLVLRVVKERAEDRMVSEKDLHFLARFYSGALVALVMEWVKNDMKDEPQELITSLEAVVSGNIDQALDHFCSNRPALLEA